MLGRSVLVKILITGLISVMVALLVSCGGSSKEESEQQTPDSTGENAIQSGAASASHINDSAAIARYQSNTNTQNQAEQTPPKAPLSTSYFVLDPQTNVIFELNRNNGSIIHRYSKQEPVVAIAHDTEKDLLYEAIGGKEPGLEIFDISSRKVAEKIPIPDHPSAMFFHPTQRQLYMVSEDSSYLRVFDPDSSKFTLLLRMRIQTNKVIGPKTLQVGPLNKLVAADGDLNAVTQILTENRFMYQTVIVHDAWGVTSAAFAFDGNSAFITDTKQGAIFRIEFGSGKYLAQKYKLNKPRLVQFDVNSQTVCVVENDIEGAFYNPSARQLRRTACRLQRRNTVADSRFE